MTSKRRRFFAVVAVVAALTLVVTGCGSTTDNGGTDGATATEVVIGIGAPLSDGAVALGKGMVRGTELAVEQANASQELKDLGLTITTVEGDDKGDPTTGGSVATQFTSNPNLVGVMGHLNSGVTRVAVKIYNQAGIVQVSPANTADSVQGPAAADYAFKVAGKKTAFVVDDATVYGTGLADEWAKQFETNGGKVAGREKTTDKDTDFKALVTLIKSSGAEIVYYGGIYNSGALLSKQMKEGGVNVPLMGGDGIFDPEYIKLAGAANATGDFATSVGLPLADLPNGQEFQAAFKAKFPGEDIAAYDAYSFDAANVIIKAIVQVAKDLGADKLTTTEGKAAIVAAVAKSSFEGVTGKVEFDAKGDTTNKAITVYSVGADGVWAPAAK